MRGYQSKSLRKSSSEAGEANFFCFFLVFFPGLLTNWRVLGRFLGFQL